MNSPIICISEYTLPVSDEKVLSFLKLIFYERKNIKQAAKYYNIKYITAKKLVRQFQHNRLVVEKKYQPEYKALFSFVQKKNKNHEMIQSIHYNKFIGINKTYQEQEKEINLKIRSITSFLQELHIEIIQIQELLIWIEIKMYHILEQYKMRQLSDLKFYNHNGINNSIFG